MKPPHTLLHRVVVVSRLLGMAAALGLLALGPWPAGALAATITGPKTVPPNTPVFLAVADLPADAQIAWEIVPFVGTSGQFVSDLQTRSGAPVAFFWSAKPGRYALIVPVVDSAGRLAVLRHDLTVTGDPQPDPDPQPPPRPPTPPEPTDPAAQWVAWTQKTVAEKVPETARGRAAELARAILATASRARAGSFGATREAREHFRRVNAVALGPDVAAWGPFSDALKVQLDKLAAAGKLDELGQYATIWEYLARGLQAVAAGRGEWRPDPPAALQQTPQYLPPSAATWPALSPAGCPGGNCPSGNCPTGPPPMPAGRFMTPWGP